MYNIKSKHTNGTVTTITFFRVESNDQLYLTIFEVFSQTSSATCPILRLAWGIVLSNVGSLVEEIVGSQLFQ